MTLVTERKNIKKKAQVVEEVNDLFNQYDTIAIADLHKVRAIQLQQLAQKLRKDVQMKVIKNSLVARVLKKNKKPNIEKLAEHLEGASILLLTNMNPFKLALLLEKNKMLVTAKAGDVAPMDIIIPAGNTGFPPGPVISELHDVGIRTRINLGSVWVIRDATIAKKGEVIQMKVASALSKLGFKPIEVRLRIRGSYDHGSIFTSDQLRPKIAEVKKQFEDALVQAFNLAVNSMYPTPATVKLVLQQAHRKARNLAINSNYATPEVAHEIVAKAHRHMLSLAAKIGAINKDAVPPELR